MTANDQNLDGWVREILRCPRTGSPLIDATGPAGEPELHSTAAGTRYAYPVREGIPVLLADAAREVV